MSDFISNLVMKDLNSTSILKPQLPSLFLPFSKFNNELANSDLMEFLGRNSKNANTDSSKIKSIFTTQPDDQSEPENDLLNNFPVVDKYESTKLNKEMDQASQFSDDNSIIVPRQPAFSAVSKSKIVDQEADLSGDKPGKYFDNTSPIESSSNLSQLYEEPRFDKDSDGITVIVAPRNQAEQPAVNHQDQDSITIRKVFNGLKSKQSKKIPDVPSSENNSNQQTDPPNEKKDILLTHILKNTQRVNSSSIEQAKNNFSENQLTSVATIIQPKNRQKKFFEFPPNSKLAVKNNSAPTVRVNIGRIDVRAVMPPAPLSKPQQTKSVPVLSLQDYLKQRNNGG